MAESPTILILTASTGAGHLVAADALAHAFGAARPGADVEVLDVLRISNAFFRRLYAGGYLGLVRHAPAAMGWLYDATDRDGRLRERLRVTVQNLNKLPTTRYVRYRRPDLIVNTHFLPAEFVAQLRRQGQLDCPQVTVTTDFETHRMWVQEPTERYYTATELGKRYLTTWGVGEERIIVSGIPVRPGFTSKLDVAEARQRCGIAVDVPTVLLLCGGFGVGPIAELFAQLLTMSSDGQVVVIAGRNERLRRRLGRLAEGTSRPVRVVGYTNRMHEWMQAADLIVSKPGGLTVSEALACGVPLVVVNPIPGQEARNSDFLLESGAAIKVNNPRLLGYRVGSLLSTNDRLARLREGVGAIARPDAAERIAANALKLLTAAAS